jgi:hypothetical protein
MAPIPDSTIKSYISFLLKRTPSPSTTSDLSPKAAFLTARTQDLVSRTVDAGSGVTPPTSIPNKAVFALFGLIGVGFVLTGIWFFFWAKNGGFYFGENDWDDYKSTVFRRKGPNGTTLSGATASTDLGGGSVVHGQKNSRSGKGRKKGGKQKRYKDFDDEESQVIGSSLGGSTLGSEMSELKEKTKKAKKSRGKDRQEGSELMSEIDLNEEVDPGVLDAVRAYRHEKPARVGGLNKHPDGIAFDRSTQDNSSATSELLSNRERTPTTTPTKMRKHRKDNYTGGTGGIRKVVSTSESGNSNFSSRSAGSNRQTEEENHIKAEARKLQEKGRAAQRRDFSFRIGDDSTVASDERSARREDRERRRASRSPTKKVPRIQYEESLLESDISGDIGTKSYHHPIPGLSSTAGSSDYAEERRKKRNGGYRRGRTEED